VRYLVLSDIHANLDALESVLTAAPSRTWDRVIVLGDLVGYGAEPNAVVDRIRALDPVAVIRGNHDKAGCGLDDGSSFNHVARMAAVWTLQALSPANREYLRALPAGPAVIDDRLEICHGAPFDEDAYIFDELDAVRALKVSTRPLCLFGHTHYPVTFELSDEAFESIGPNPAPESYIQMRNGSKYLVNPGSVGQPRDGDPRAAYAIADTARHRVELFRLKYPVEEAQAKVIKAGLAEVLAHRLAVGR
jgi:diadenosine tetraphosphatase ApaH/serine/threonine PP2A family protein phosphatase